MEFRLYAVTDRGLLAGRPLAEALAELASLGVRGVQLREKDLGAEALSLLAAECRAALEGSGVKWLVNGDAGVAARAGASGVHLPATGSPAAAWSAAPSGFLVGQSAHGEAEAGAAARAGADFVVVGPVFATPSKAAFGPPLGPAVLAAAVAAAAPVPVLAIGGVTPERAKECREAGAAGVAALAPVMRAVRAGAPAGEAAGLLARYAEALGGL